MEANRKEGKMEDHIEIEIDGKIEKLFKEHQIKCPYCENPINSMKPIKIDERTKTVIFVCQCWSGEISVYEPRHYFLVKISHLKEVEFDNNLLPYD